MDDNLRWSHHAAYACRRYEPVGTQFEHARTSSAPPPVRLLKRWLRHAASPGCPRAPTRLGMTTRCRHRPAQSSNHAASTLTEGRRHDSSIALLWVVTERQMTDGPVSGMSARRRRWAQARWAAHDSGNIGQPWMAARGVLPTWLRRCHPGSTPTRRSPQRCANRPIGKFPTVTCV